MKGIIHIIAIIVVILIAVGFFAYRLIFKDSYCMAFGYDNDKEYCFRGGVEQLCKTDSDCRSSMKRCDVKCSNYIIYSTCDYITGRYSPFPTCTPILSGCSGNVECPPNHNCVGNYCKVL